jgi:hypothetical protein
MMSDHPPVDQRLTPPHLSLIALLILTGLCFAFVWGADTILPVRIDEGPLIQMPQPMQTTLVWYTSRPAKCTLHVEGHLSSPISPESSENQQRHTANLGRLSPDTEYAYRITLESGRELFSGTLDSPKDANALFSFIVFGDSGKGTRAQYALAQQMLERRPDFMLHTGDLVYSDGARHKYPDRFFGPYRKTIARVPFFPCLGNHDIAEDGRALPYESVFELPQNGPDGRPADHEYWFDYGSARFAVFDSNISQAEMESKIAPWLREVFDANAPEWRFISCHHPPLHRRQLHSRRPGRAEDLGPHLRRNRHRRRVLWPRPQLPAPDPPSRRPTGRRRHPLHHHRRRRSQALRTKTTRSNVH